MRDFQKFETRRPSAQNAIDIFSGAWASNLSEVAAVVGTGVASHFIADGRPRMLLKHFASERGNLEGKHILELGPLEGGHSYQLERMGAEVTAVEANAEAYLKCLIVKELVGLKKTRFMLGDLTEYMENTDTTFDIVFCCGVLYHMQDPLNVLRLMSTKSSRVFIWTHYFTPESRPNLVPMRVNRYGMDATYHVLEYPNMDSATFWGGNAPTAAFLTRDGILAGLGSKPNQPLEADGQIMIPTP